ncbi:MAG: hypothetical protein ACI3Z9_00965 [Candidatus Onthomorpha sp.]
MKHYAVFVFVVVFTSVLPLEAQFCFSDTSFENGDTTIEKGSLLFHIADKSFFVDNEYTGEKTYGYSLPGFRLTPTLFYALNEKISLEAGVSMLRYHGANRYPCVIYSYFPTWQAYQFLSGLHLMPYFRALWNISSTMQLAFGNIDNRNSHLLPEPLYNVEHTFSSDPEAGVQFCLNKPHQYLDVWLNWQSFVFANDIHQETFTFGANWQTKFDLVKEKLRLVIPVSLIIQHLGGENLSGDFSVCTWSNIAAGMRLDFKHNRLISSIGADYLYYNQAGETDIVPFENGQAAYPYIELAYKQFKIKFAYYDSEDFVSLLGSPHFCNFSTNTPDLVFDRSNQFYIRGTYRYDICKGCCFDAYFQLFRQNHLTGDRPGFEKVIRDGFISFSFGIILNIDHSILLKRF